MPKITDLFEVAAGSVPGTDHVGTGRNNQDGYACRWHEDTLVALVCDGCSGCAHSEVGAKVGARLAAEALLYHASYRPRPEQDSVLQCLDFVRRDVLEALEELARDMGPKASRVASEYFLFTLVGAVVTEELAFTFSLGDGVVLVNDHYLRLGPFPNNAPPYLAYYGLVGSTLAVEEPYSLRFHVHNLLPTRDVESLLVGSDGLVDARAAEDLYLPGTREPFGPLSQFCEQDKYYANPDAVRRRLAQANRRVTHIDWEARTRHDEPGLLPDDTTLVALRRRR
jgi:hypothetical protein